MAAGWMKRLFFIHKTDLPVPMSMCSNMFCFADLHIYSHTKKNCQDDSNRNRNPVDLYQIYCDIQNTKGFQWWDTRSYFTHANFDSFIVCILPRSNLVIHTVSPKDYILSIWVMVYLFSFLGKPRLQNKWAITHSFQSLVKSGRRFSPKSVWSYYDYPSLVCCYFC